MAQNSGVVFESNLPNVKTTMKKAMEAGLEAIGIYLADQAVRNITSAKAVDLGQLRTSMSEPGYKVVPDDKLVAVGTNVEYAVYVESGTGIYADGGGGRKTPWRYYYEGKKGRTGWRWTRGQKPVHFLRDAFTKHPEVIEKVYTAAYQANMEE